MKPLNINCILFNIVLVFTLPSFGQNVVISTLEKQFVYFNVNNPLLIGVFNYSEEDLVLNTNNGTIFKSSNTYFIKPTNDNSREASIYCYLLTNNKMDTTLISTLTFNVKKLPLPQVEYSPKEGHSSLPSLWSKQGKLILSYNISSNGLMLDSLSRIISFDVSIKDKKSKIDTIINVQGNKMPAIFNEFINQCHKDAEIEFFNILIWTDWTNPKEYLYDKYFEDEEEIQRKRLKYKID